MGLLTFWSGRAPKESSEIRFRRAMREIDSLIKRNQNHKDRLWDYGKKALMLGDRDQFEQIAQAYLHTLQTVHRWERYKLAAQTLDLKRGQAALTGEFVSSLDLMAQSLIRDVDDSGISKMHEQVEKALHRSRTVEDTLDAVMEAASESIYSADETAASDIAAIEKAMKETGPSEAIAEEGELKELNERISGGVKKLEEELRKDLS